MSKHVQPVIPEQSPTVSVIAAALEGRIRSGELPSGRRMPSERTLAEEFGVSRKTVSSVISILEQRGFLVRQHGCRPVVRQSPERQENAAGIKPREIMVWLWPNLGDFGSGSSILRGIQRAIQDPQFKLVVASAVGSGWDAVISSEERFLRQAAADPGVAGAILWYLGSEANLSALAALQASGAPVVYVDRKPHEAVAADYVGTYNLGAARAIVRHLLELGHRKIACVTNMDPAASVRERIEGYRSALASANIQVADEYIYVPVERPYDTLSGVADRAVDHLMGLPDPPTAIFVVNDCTALEVYRALENRGLSVPQDVSVTGFDGLLHWLPGGGNLTTARQDFEGIGEAAAELLLDRIAGRAPRAFKHIMLGAPLQVCGSTARPPESQSLNGKVAEARSPQNGDQALSSFLTSSRKDHAI